MARTSTQRDDVDAISLPTNRAFVLQFRQDSDVNGGRVDGRIEHITSGRAELFHTLEELVSFVGENLAVPSGTMPNDVFDLDN